MFLDTGEAGLEEITQQFQVDPSCLACAADDQVEWQSVRRAAAAFTGIFSLDGFFVDRFRIT